MKNYQRHSLLEAMINYNIAIFNQSTLKSYLEKLDIKVVVESGSTKCLTMSEYTNYSDINGVCLYEYVAKPYRNKYRVWFKKTSDFLK